MMELDFLGIYLKHVEYLSIFMGMISILMKNLKCPLQRTECNADNGYKELLGIPSVVIALYQQIKYAKVKKLEMNWFSYRLRKLKETNPKFGNMMNRAEKLVSVIENIYVKSEKNIQLIANQNHTTSILTITQM